MPTPTYFPLANITLGSSASSVTFSSIPATYRDLVLIYYGLGSTADAGHRVEVNGDTGNNYSVVRMAGGPSSVVSSSATTNYFPLLYSASPQNGMAILQIMDYSATDKHKTALTRANHISQSTVEALASRWANTAAITSLKILQSSGTLQSGTTIALYGIAS